MNLHTGIGYLIEFAALVMFFFGSFLIEEGLCFESKIIQRDVLATRSKVV